MKDGAARRNIVGGLLAIFLFGVAYYLWKAPARREALLQKSSLTELQQQAEKSPGDARVLYYLGRKQEDDGDVHRAFETLSRAADAAPGQEEIWVAAAHAAEKVSGWQGADNILTAFTKNYPNSAAAQKALARLELLRQNAKEARAALDVALRLNPEDGATWRLLGETAKIEGDVRGVTEAMAKAVLYAPGDWQAQVGQGDALSLQNHDNDALRCYREAIRLAPKEPIPYLGLSRSLLRASSGSDAAREAREAAQKYLSLRGSGPQPYLFIAESFRRERKEAEAQETLEKAESLYPTDVNILYSLARAYRALGETAQATAVLERQRRLIAFEERKQALFQKISNAERTGDMTTARRLHIEVARSFEANGAYLAALDHFLKAQALSAVSENIGPDIARLLQRPELAGLRYRNRSPEDILSEAKTALKAKQYDKASQAFLAALKQDPRNVAAMEGVGLALLGREREGDAATAVKYLISATRLDPKRAVAQMALGDLYQAAHLPEEAQKCYQAATEADPGDAAAWRRLGTVLRTFASHKEETEAAFARAVELSPNDAGLRLDQAEALAELGKTDAAETAYRAALARAADAQEVQARVGAFLARSNNADKRAEAEKLLRSALSADSNDDFTRYQLGALLAGENNLREAVALLEQSVAHDERALDALYALSRAYRKAGDAARADVTLRRADALQKEYIAYNKAKDDLAANPDDPGRFLHVARLAIKQNDASRALASYRQALRLDPNNAAARQEMTTLEARLKSEKAGQDTIATYDALLDATKRLR